MSNFPTTWTPNPRYTFKEPEKKSRNGRLLACIFVGAVVGLFLSVALNANIWLPAGALVAFSLMAVGEGEK